MEQRMDLRETVEKDVRPVYIYVQLGLSYE